MNPLPILFTRIGFAATFFLTLPHFLHNQKEIVTLYIYWYTMVRAFFPLSFVYRASGTSTVEMCVISLHIDIQ